MGPRARRFAIAGMCLAAFAGAGAFALDRLDRAYPPPLPGEQGLSVTLNDRDGALLKVFPNADGRYRLPVELSRVDPKFVEMLVSYEDRRFRSHMGVDPLAVARAAWQFVANGRIVSGGSTITMQLARLLEPREERSMAAKIRQALRALQLERRLSKDEILRAYLTLAPYGGNVEGIRAASLAWFGKEPGRLRVAEAALLVALPQSPETRRPDRHNANALAARGRVMERMVKNGVLDAGEATRIAAFPAPDRRLAMPQLAPHLAQAAIDRDPLALAHESRLDAGVQARMEELARSAARRLGPKLSVAIVVADASTGDILASVGSPGLHERGRDGFIDMTQRLRSPGSTLKPLIYALAIEDGLVVPETLISDRPADFSGYRPANFDMRYMGDVSVRAALQYSLNVPAVRLLDAVTPARLAQRMRRAGVEAVLPDGERPGLSMALGGLGITLTDLVQLYANFVSPGNSPLELGDGVRGEPGRLGGPRMVSPVAAWHAGDMLSGIAEPAGSRPLAISYKTGTSYGYRDAWSVGFDGRHVIGVWVGRPDNGSSPGISGAVTAAPVLFAAFEKSGLALVALPRAPAGAVRLSADEVPPPLRRFERGRGALSASAPSGAEELHIAFPADGSEIEMAGPADAPVVVKLQGGKPPFRMLENGRPVEGASRRRQLLWTPDGAGSARLTVVDAAGQARSVRVVLR
jgi:penicillin-binding protein 1C